MEKTERYYELRDNLAIGIANMAKVYDVQITGDKKQFEDVFEFTMIQLKLFDEFWEKINL